MTSQNKLEPEWVAPGRTALLLIDMQVDFGSPDGAMARRGLDVTACQAAAQKAEELADAARAAGVPVMFVRLLIYPGGENRFIREFQTRQGNDQGDDPLDLCALGTRGADFIGPQPQDGEPVFSKTRFSAFTQTGLADRLHALGADTLVLAGLTTECCIQSSAWDAVERDFHVFIAEDACAAYEAGLHRHALEALRLSAAIVIPVAALATAWK